MIGAYVNGQIFGYRPVIPSSQGALPATGRITYFGPFLVFVTTTVTNEVTLTDFLHIADDTTVPVNIRTVLLTDNLSELSDLIQKKLSKVLDDSIVIDDALTTKLLQRIARTLTDFLPMSDHVEEEYIPAVYIWFLKGGVKIEIKGH